MSQFKGFPINLMSKQKTGFTLPFEKWLTKNNEDYLNVVIKNLDEKFSFDQNYLKDIFFKKCYQRKICLVEKMAIDCFVKLGNQLNFETLCHMKKKIFSIIL